MNPRNFNRIALKNDPLLIANLVFSVLLFVLTLIITIIIIVNIPKIEEILN